ncbi:thioredoxin family protein [Virgibacillus doumboii]|uniref:thioredoxin family protein n=1 Tax=Virgibacillus doumboii TaxID=2697503 RepID=UPI0013DF5467|nr:thioredoxin family protein [Virgibacillus doumboii]
MQKKMLIILASIVVLFIALYFVIDYKNQQAIGDNENPYGKDDLHQATIDQLDDPLYDNQILPDELQTQLDNGENMVVYFYSPTCPHCQRTTPVLAPLAEDMGVDMKKLNLLEFQDAWGQFGIESTPTLVYYENGKEVDRVNGAQAEDLYRAFFNEYVVTDDSKNEAS